VDLQHVYNNSDAVYILVIGPFPSNFSFSFLTNISQSIATRTV